MRLKPSRRRDGDDALFVFCEQDFTRHLRRLHRAIPASPRCKLCMRPFAGLGRLLWGGGFSPSRKNPNFCKLCFEQAPVGSREMEVGVLFADVRGYTAMGESRPLGEITALMNRFYELATDVLVRNDAVIDKLIGDEVMALYVPPIALHGHELHDEHRTALAKLMLDHARQLLVQVGYGTPDGPFVELGVGIDFGEVFIGNVGDQAVHDFTAIGDVVNTAARLQGHAAGGEAIVSARVAAHLDAALGPAEELSLKGKAEPFRAHRVSWDAP